MRLNLAEVLAGDGYTLPFEITQKFDPISFGGAEYRFLEPVSIKGRVANLHGDVGIKATIKGTLTTGCARCGEEAQYSFDIEVLEKIVQNEEDEGVTLTGNYIDLAEVARVNVVTEIPIQILCSENCRGVCYKCGANLNIAECGCGDDTAGPLWDMIKNLNWKDEV